MVNRSVVMHLVLILINGYACGMGYQVKTSPPIDQPGVEVLGEYKGSWYVIGFDKPGNLNKPPAYKLYKYETGFANAKVSAVYPSFGEKTAYLKTVIMNNKISVFYAKCERRSEEEALLDKREGHRQMDVIMCIEYDPLSLEQIGEPKRFFLEDEDHFSSSGIEIAQSEDKTKTALLVKCYYRQTAYKLIYTDNAVGQVYSKTFSFKDLKEYLAFRNMKVGNNGLVLLETKVRDDVVKLSQTAKGQNKPLYYFFVINTKGEQAKPLTLTTPISAGRFSDEPVTAMLNNGEMLIAYDYFNEEKSAMPKGISVAKYDASLTQQASQDIAPDSKLLAQVAEPSGKKENGFSNLAIQQILPLDGGNFMLIAEYQHEAEGKTKEDPKFLERNYLITYRFDDKMSLGNFHFIAKKQSSAKFGFALSAQAYRRGNEVYIFHNDDWDSDEEHGIALQCSRLPATGGEADTRKVVVTADDFFTSMEHFYPRNDGRVLFTEEKQVEFEDVSKQVKLLEVTLR